MTKITKTNQRKRMPKRKTTKSKSLGELNAWMSANYNGLLESARRNCIALTGKPTFGGMRTRKSA